MRWIDVQRSGVLTKPADHAPGVRRRAVWITESIVDGNRHHTPCSKLARARIDPRRISGNPTAAMEEHDSATRLALRTCVKHMRFDYRAILTDDAFQPRRKLALSPRRRCAQRYQSRQCRPHRSLAGAMLTSPTHDEKRGAYCCC